MPEKSFSMTKKDIKVLKFTKDKIWVTAKSSLKFYTMPGNESVHCLHEVK